MTRHLPEEDRRAQILRAARHCFVERGFHPTRMDDIAKEAGLSKGGVYFHFKSKQEVFSTLVESEFERSMGLLLQVMGAELSMGEKIAQLAGHYLQFFSQAPDEPRFLIVMAEMALRDEAVAARLLEMQQAYIVQIAKLIEMGTDEKLLKPVDYESVAILLKALLDGVEGLHALNYPLDLSRFLQAGLQLLNEGLLQDPAEA